MSGASTFFLFRCPSYFFPKNFLAYIDRIWPVLKITKKVSPSYSGPSTFAKKCFLARPYKRMEYQIPPCNTGVNRAKIISKKRMILPNKKRLTLHVPLSRSKIAHYIFFFLQFFLSFRLWLDYRNCLNWRCSLWRDEMMFEDRLSTRLEFYSTNPEREL